MANVMVEKAVNAATWLGGRAGRYAVTTVEPAINPETAPGIHAVDNLSDVHGSKSFIEHFVYSAIYDQPAPRKVTLATLYKY